MQVKFSHLNGHCGHSAPGKGKPLTVLTDFSSFSVNFIWTYMSVYLSVVLQILSTALLRNVQVLSLSKGFQPFTQSLFHLDWASVCPCAHTRFPFSLSFTPSQTTSFSALCH